MQVFIKTAENLQEKHPDLQFCLSHAPNLSDRVYEKYLKNCPFKVIKGENQALLSVYAAMGGLGYARQTIACLMVYAMYLQRLTVICYYLRLTVRMQLESLDYTVGTMMQKWISR